MGALDDLARAGNAGHADSVGLDVLDRLAKSLLRHARKMGDGSVSLRTVIELHASQGELAAALESPARR